MNQISGKQKKYLKGLAHNLNPVVMVGNKGVSEAVLKEIDTTLSDHELIKIRIRCEDQEELATILESITANTKAELIQVIGHSVVLFRPSSEGKISLP